MSKYNAHGTLLKLGDALVSPSYTTVAQVTSVGGPNMSRGTTNVPTHDDSGGVDKIADALYDGGDVTFEVMYDPADGTHDETTGFRELMDSGDERPWQLVWPSSLGQEDFNAFVTGFNPGPFDANSGMFTASLTLTVTGDVTPT